VLKDKLYPWIKKSQTLNEGVQTVKNTITAATLIKMWDLVNMVMNL
jgi:hypothetical protein